MEFFISQILLYGIKLGRKKSLSMDKEYKSSDKFGVKEEIQKILDLYSGTR